MSPKLTASKESIQGPAPLPEGLYDIRFVEFDPKYSKDRGSINLRPQMRIINHADFNDRPIFDNLNTKAQFIWKDFCHCFGVPMVADESGDYPFPGKFNGPDDQPDQWTYEGPILGQTGQVYIVQGDNGSGGVATKIKQYVCKVPGCNERHSKNLAR